MFKALKQNLRIKTFVGTTANALKTQIWTALIALLAVKFLQLEARFPWSLSRLVALLRKQLRLTVICGSGWNRLLNRRLHSHPRVHPKSPLSCLLLPDCRPPTRFGRFTSDPTFW